MLNDLFASVQRAGPVFTGQALMAPDGEGYKVTLQLVPHAFNKNELGAKVQRTLGGYIRTYLRENGWRSKGGSFRGSYFVLCIAASKAASSTSQKRSAIL